MSINESHLQDIYNVIRSPDCNILKISAPTGSGKSVKVPRYLAHKGNRTFVSIPNIVSVKSVFNYQQNTNTITDEFKSKIGMAANTRIEEKQYNDSSILVYATTGHVLNLMLNNVSKNKKLDFCKVLIVDEVHDTGADTKLILNLYNYAARSGMPIPKLIMMSATPIDFDFIPQLKIKEYTVKEERKYGIKLEYLDILPIKEKLNGQIVKAVTDNLNTNRGHILVFLPGVPEINRISSILAPTLSDEYVLLKLYGTQKDNINVHNSYGGKKKIILSTNVAESSITIADVGLVIDTGLEKLSVKPTIEGSTRLEVRHISKNSATQRMGRTGRTMPGKCIRLYPKDFYDNMKDNTENEMDRLPLYRVCLKIMSYNLDPLKVLIPLYKNKVEKSLRYFTKLDLITDDKLNYRGRLCNRSSFGFRNTLIVEESSIKSQMIIILSICEEMTTDILRGTKEEPLKYLVKLWNDFARIEAEQTDSVIRQFCNDKGINFYNFKDILAVIQSQFIIYNVKGGAILKIKEIERELYETRYTTILKNGDFVINKSIDPYGRYKNMDVIVLNSFESGKTIIVNVFLPYEFNATKTKRNVGRYDIRYGLGNYFILNKIEEVENKDYFISLLN